MPMRNYIKHGGYDMKHKYDTNVIISSELANLGEIDNLERTSELADILTTLGFSHKQVLGMYQNTSETSFLVDIPDVSRIEKLHHLAVEFGQNSILVLNPDRTAYLMFSDGTEQVIPGIFQEVSRAVAEEKQNYTYDMETGKYYTVL